MTISIGFSLPFVRGRVSPVSAAPPGPSGSVFNTSIKDSVAGELVIDAVVRETPDYQVDITQLPRERGLPVTDNARPKPVKVTLEGIISNTPLGAGESRLVRYRGVDFESTALVESAPGEPGFADDAFAFLEDLHANPREVTIVTPRKTYEGMVMASFSPPADAKTGDSIQFTCVFQHIETVEVKKVTKQVRLQAKRKTGKQETKETTPPKNVSALKNLINDRVGGL